MAGDAGSRKKMVTIGVSSLILVACVVAVAVGVKNHNSSDKAEEKPADSGTGDHLSSSSKAVESICQPTDYKQSCQESLSSAGNTTNPKELVRIAFEYTVNKIKEGTEKSTTLKELEKDPRGKMALDDCKNLIGYAEDDLKRSIDQLGQFDATKIDNFLDDLKIWLSATITYQQTCLDGFLNTTGDAGENMRKALNISMQLTSNGIAMVSNISSFLGDLNIPVLSRRLLVSQAEEPLPHHPRWLTESKRELVEAAPAKLTPNVVVAQDGSGKYKTITEALKEVPVNGTKPFLIYVKEGVYKENVVIGLEQTHVMIYGDGPSKTKITGSRSFSDGFTVLETATVVAIGSDFIAKDIGFENTAGPEKHQAVALRVASDRSIFYNCQIDGYESTLYVHTHRQFYRDCTITGTMDFVFGDAAAVLQNCKFLIRKPTDLIQPCTVTAQQRSDRFETTVILIQNGTISADPTLLPVKNTIKAYLGRPAKMYSRTIIANTQIDDVIQPEGWVPYSGTFGTTTCFYAEINNKGPGADKTKRVKWAGLKNLDATEAANYGPNRFFKSDSWIIDANIPYTASLTLSEDIY